MTNKMEFVNYLNSLKLAVINVKETNSAFEAIIASNSVPNLANFTNVFQNADKSFWVRLAKVDIPNEAITNGFFA